MIVFNIATRIKLVVLLSFGFTVCLSVSKNIVFSQNDGRTSTSFFKFIIPKGIPGEKWRKLIPSTNPITEEKVALGRSLYFDKKLSADGTVSCATCHDAATAFADRNPIAVGVKGHKGTRNAPTLLNIAFNDLLFWDGRVSSLEEQAKGPLTNPAEMGEQSYSAVVAKVTALPEYRREFSQVFGDEGITIDTITKAIAAFERTQLSGNSPFDRFITGDGSAMTATQKRGWELFNGKAQCISCHTYSTSSPFFTDFDFHNTGIATEGTSLGELARRVGRGDLGDQVTANNLSKLNHIVGVAELGRFLVTRQAKDIAAFKTPTLRDVELTAPYMHNGSVTTLLDVVRFYNEGGNRNAYLDSRMRPLDLSEAEINDLVEFLRALTSDDVLRQVQTAAPQTRTPVPLSATRRR